MTMQSDFAATAAAAPPARGSAMGPALWRNRLLLGLVGLHFCAVYATCLMLGKPFSSGTVDTLVALLKLQVPLFIILLTLWRFGWVMLWLRPERPLAWFAADLRGIVTDRDRMFTGIFAFVAMCLFASSFSVAKDLIPVIHPFSWDPAFAALDRMLHGGVDPWRLLFPLTGTPLVTTIINAGYHLWLMLAYFLIFVACFNLTRHEKHRRYLVTDLLTWVIGGNILATIFSSVGPVYYEAFGYGADFVPLMDQLRAFNEISPVWALNVQDMLLAGYLGEGGDIKGISAMPSMHVASTMTMTLYAFSVSRVFGWAMTGFLALILVGSVQLGWHYAIDGYVSILLVLVMWWVSGRLLRLVPNG
ncbi:MAG: phosphatase PAP2 family protein [Roseovarius sp.]